MVGVLLTAAADDDANLERTIMWVCVLLVRCFPISSFLSMLPTKWILLPVFAYHSKVNDWFSRFFVFFFFCKFYWGFSLVFFQLNIFAYFPNFCLTHSNTEIFMKMAQKFIYFGKNVWFLLSANLCFCF